EVGARRGHPYAPSGEGAARLETGLEDLAGGPGGHLVHPAELVLLVVDRHVAVVPHDEPTTTEIERHLLVRARQAEQHPVRGHDAEQREASVAAPQLELRAVDPESTGSTPALERRRRPAPEPASEDRSGSRTPDERWGTPTGAQRQHQEAGDNA